MTYIRRRSVAGHYAIVDEADSVFIDEAATPLLISGDGPNQAYIEAYEQALLD